MLTLPARSTGKDPREYSINTKEFVSDGNGNIKGINTIRVHWEKDALGQWRMAEVPGSEQCAFLL